MRFLWVSIALVVAGVLGTFSSGTAQAAIHEIVAAYCSGGGVGAIDEDGFLEPPGVSDPAEETFAKPVMASGAVTEPDGEGIVRIADKPNTKFPAGTEVVDLSPPAPTPLLEVSESDHPSAAHCPGAAGLP